MEPGVFLEVVYILFCFYYIALCLYVEYTAEREETDSKVPQHQRTCQIVLL